MGVRDRECSQVTRSIIRTISRRCRHSPAGVSDVPRWLRGVEPQLEAGQLPAVEAVLLALGSLDSSLTDVGGPLEGLAAEVFSAPSDRTLWLGIERCRAAGDRGELEAERLCQVLEELGEADPAEAVSYLEEIRRELGPGGAVGIPVGRAREVLEERLRWMLEAEELERCRRELEERGARLGMTFAPVRELPLDSGSGAGCPVSAKGVREIRRIRTAAPVLPASDLPPSEREPAEASSSEAPTFCERPRYVIRHSQSQGRGWLAPVPCRSKSCRRCGEVLVEENLAGFLRELGGDAAYRLEVPNTSQAREAARKRISRAGGYYKAMPADAEVLVVFSSVPVLDAVEVPGVEVPAVLRADLERALAVPGSNIGGSHRVKRYRPEPQAVPTGEELPADAEVLGVTVAPFFAVRAKLERRFGDLEVMRDRLGRLPAQERRSYRVEVQDRGSLERALRGMYVPASYLDKLRHRELRTAVCG